MSARGQVVKKMDGELIKVHGDEGKERASLRRKEKGDGEEKKGKSTEQIKSKEIKRGGERRGDE